MFPLRGESFRVSFFLAKETSELIKNHIRRCQGIYFKAQEANPFFFYGEASFSEDKPVFIIPFFIKVCFNLNILGAPQTHLNRESTVLIIYFIPCRSCLSNSKLEKNYGFSSHESQDRTAYGA